MREKRCKNRIWKKSGWKSRKKNVKLSNASIRSARCGRSDFGVFWRVVAGVKATWKGTEVRQFPWRIVDFPWRIVEYQHVAVGAVVLESLLRINSWWFSLLTNKYAIITSCGAAPHDRCKGIWRCSDQKWESCVSSYYCRIHILKSMDCVIAITSMNRALTFAAGNCSPPILWRIITWPCGWSARTQYRYTSERTSIHTDVTTYVKHAFIKSLLPKLKDVFCGKKRPRIRRTSKKQSNLQNQNQEAICLDTPGMVSPPEDHFHHISVPLWKPQRQ